ncbi:amidohydrolase [Aquamicrobium sp. LC103]|uniref:amidohydrolase n=1 Tax=Aquamicrobium sp. LC103 TaxID=1120658 RepID=UPI00063E6E92|nr:amidohydrolase [Aquamicrobium sp. LC103]TKT76341.1 amidohydrolase [Aquamicrobium sp. LC103]
MPAPQDVLVRLDAHVTRLKPTFAAVADEIWAHPELGFEEVRSAAAQIRAMKAEGFRIERDVAGLKTAFIAETGTQGPVIAILGEFDALPGLSQQAGVTTPVPVEQGAPGHGCGHNLLGAGSMLAAAALAATLRETGMPGIVRYYGCPAEEGGFGKVIMVRDGAFDDAAATLGWHPGTFNGVRARSTLAVMNRTYRFHGRAAHAAMSPHLGRSALDALELMNIGANFLREHMPQDARLHYAITDSGGSAPGVVQARAAALYFIRAPELDELRDLVARVDDIARGAALMTSTEVEILAAGGASNVIPNSVLCKTMHAAMERLGPLAYSDADRAYAAQIRATLPGLADSDRKALGEPDMFACGQEGKVSLHAGLRRYDGRMWQGSGSTDVGDVSWMVPTVECATATWAAGTPSHSWQVVAQGCSPAAHKAMAHAAATIGGTALTLLADPDLLDAARREHAERRAGRDYHSPLTF